MNTAGKLGTVQLESLVYGTALNPLARRWLTSGILNSVRRGESLDRALCLCSRGQDSLRRRLAMIQRNQFLVEALDAVALDDRISTWQRCLRLAPLVHQFIGTPWRQTKRLSAPPNDWAAYKKCLWNAACTDLELPESAHGLRLVAIEQNRAYSGKAAGAKLLSQFL